ncbi:MAG: carbohydrate kinase family protein [Phycisphaerales bacterium]
MLSEAVFRGRCLAIIGNICRDVKMGPLRPGLYLQEDGETPTAFITETIGGGGANSALAAAALGADVRFAGKVGTDVLGQRLEQSLVHHGVKTFLHRDPDVVTGSSVVLNYESGCRHFVSCQPNNYGLQMSDIAPALLAGAGHLLRADVWFSEPMLAGGNEALLLAARNKGVATSLDINWDPQWGTADSAKIARRKAAVRNILPLVDLVHGNIRELNRFADSDDLDTTLRKTTAWGAGAIVIHMGADGAGYYDRGQLTVVPAVPVRQCKNMAGTGDLLSVCMMLLHDCADIPPRDRLQLANTIVADYIEGRRTIIPDLT